MPRAASEYLFFFSSSEPNLNTKKFSPKLSIFTFLRVLHTCLTIILSPSICIPRFRRIFLIKQWATSISSFSFILPSKSTLSSSSSSNVIELHFLINSSVSIWPQATNCHCFTSFSSLNKCSTFRIKHTYSFSLVNCYLLKLKISPMFTHPCLLFPHLEKHITQHPVHPTCEWQYKGYDNPVCCHSEVSSEREP